MISNMLMKRSTLFIFLSILISIGISLFVYKYTVVRVAAFGCFDDCFNYTAGYFIASGKQIYSEFFFNHLPSPAYLSAFIQEISNPINIYDLLLKHRQFLLIWSIVWNILLLLRFRTKMLLVILLFETAKWYLFGTRFLAESYIVYPLMYIAGVAWISRTQKITRLELGWSLFCTCLLVVSREPYIPAAMFLLFWILINQRKTMKKFILAILFFVPFVPLLFFPLHDFWFNVVTVNTQSILKAASVQMPWYEHLVHMMFYPFFLFFSPPTHIFWHMIHLIGAIFLLLFFLSLRKKHQRGSFLLLYIALALSNSRVVPIGTVFYQGFQLLPWFALLLFSVGMLIQERMNDSRKIVYICISLIGIGWFSFIVNPTIYWKENISPQEELITNYSEEIQIGNTLSLLMNDGDDVFLDGWAELIYWQSQHISLYPYTWYTSVMPLFEQYRMARYAYLSQTPPEFYYGTCPHTDIPARQMPDEMTVLYTNIVIGNKESCLWIRTDAITQISDEQWNKAQEFLVQKP